MGKLCWFCQKDPGSGHFCQACQKIQSLSQNDYFAFMGLPWKLGIDSAVLDKTFYELSWKFHPDFFQTKSEKEKLFSREKSALLNKAYQTLKDPIERAGYLLDLEVPAPKGERTKASPSLVEEIFEIQEWVEEEKRTRDPRLKAQLESAKKEVEEKIEARRKLLSAHFEKWDTLGGDQIEKRDLAKTIRKTIDEIAYLRNLIHAIETRGAARH